MAATAAVGGVLVAIILGGAGGKDSAEQGSTPRPISSSDLTTQTAPTVSTPSTATTTTATTAECAQQSGGNAPVRGDAYEANQTIDEAVLLTPDRVALKGRRGTSNDREWFVFCSRGGEVTIAFRNVDVGEFGSGCTNLLAALRGDAPPGDDGGGPIEIERVRPDPGETSTIAYTTVAGGRYYIEIYDLLSERCRWALEISPPELLADARDPSVYSGAEASGF